MRNSIISQLLRLSGSDSLPSFCLFGEATPPQATLDENRAGTFLGSTGWGQEAQPQERKDGLGGRAPERRGHSAQQTAEPACARVDTCGLLIGDALGKA
jgi:hypothetical protein